MAELLRPDDFRDLGAPLTVEAGATRIELVVESVDELPPHRLREAPFSVVLRGPPAPMLPQATHALLHPRLGRIEVFLVPIAQDRDSARYEATFN